MKNNFLLDTITWLTSINFDDLVFKKVGPVVLYVIVLLVALFFAYKTRKDMKERSDSDFWRRFATLFVFFTNIFGYIIYVALRPNKKETETELMEKKYLELEVKGVGECMICDTTFFPEDMFCRKCGNQVRKNCARCNNVIEVNNFFCNYCGLQQLVNVQKNKKPVKVKKKSAPKKAVENEPVKKEKHLPNVNFKPLIDNIETLVKDIQSRRQEAAIKKAKEKEEREKQEKQLAEAAALAAQNQKVEVPVPPKAPEVADNLNTEIEKNDKVEFAENSDVSLETPPEKVNVDASNEINLNANISISDNLPS